MNLNDYDHIKHTVSISNVLSKHGIRHPDRDRYSIPCPIHHGIDPNFSVSERDGLWNCFSVCGRGGSVIDLVAALEEISIKEAVEKLSHDFQVSRLSSSTHSAQEVTRQWERYKKMKENTEIALPQHKNLEEGYRGLTRNTINHWGLKRNGVGVIIPLVNGTGKICSYSIRRDDGDPKYENAPGTSKAWPFGLYQNMRDIAQEGFVYIVEGQFDAITMYQFGYKNVVAIMGSQISETQAMLLLSVTGTLMLVMDGDEAGRKATEEIMKRWGSIFKIGKVELPSGLDPDEYLIKGGRL